MKNILQSTNSFCVLLFALLTASLHAAPAVFGTATNFSVGSLPRFVALDDLNGDGKPDMAVANDGSSTVSIRLGDGTGNFGTVTNFPVGSAPYAVGVADFNGDGKLDLAVANLNSNNVSILLGTGTGSFGTATNFPAGAGSAWVAVGDFNGDSKPDLATANSNTNTVSILLGTGTGSFGAATNFTVGAGPRSVAVGDFNGDGKPDLATANYGSNNASILLGTGTGSFGTATNFTVGTGPISLALGDFNGDGKPDLATANYSSNNVSRLLGTGTGSFGTATSFAAGTNPHAVQVGDLNGDGKPDLVVANFTSNNFSILLGTGTGTGSFDPATNLAQSGNPVWVAVGDLNGDAKPDLVVAGASNTFVSRRLNITNPTTTVTAVSPASGSTLGGTSVTITGTDFTGATSVTIGGTAATSVVVVDATTLTATTPAGTAGSASVLVTTPGGTNAANTLYTYVAPPTLTSVSPNTGTTAGGTNVTISGTDFTGATAVTIGGTAATSVSVTNATTLTCTTPAGSAGSVSVLVTTPSGTNAANTLYSYVVPAPTVTAVSPASGSALGGTSVTITGTNFTGATGVTFGGTAATSVVVVDATTLTATSPAGSAGSASVLVTTPSGTNAANTLFTYVAPSGTLVINTASNPTGTPNTSTDELAYASFVSTTDLLHGIVGTGGSWNTIVPNASPSGLNDGIHGGDADLIGAAFANTGTSSFRTFDLGDGPHGLGFNITEIQSIAAWFNAGYANQKYEVYVSLVGNAAFTLLTTVDFQPFAVGGGAATKVNIVDSTPGAFIARGIDAIRFNILGTASSPAGGVVMREIDVFGSAAIPEPFHITVTAVSPASGSTLGGTSVTITGTGFTGATSVTIGGTAATSVVVVDATTLTATTPAGSAGSASVLVTTPSGTNAANTLYTYVAPPTLTGVSPNTGTTAGGTNVTLTGTNFTGATNVTIGGTALTSVVVVNATTLTATTPAGSAGSASLLVTTPGGTNAANTLYTYVLPAPEIAVSGNSVSIADGDTSPDTADHTDFGSTAVVGGTVTRTFTVTNSGTGALNLSGTPKVAVGAANAADFTVTLDPVTPVGASGGMTTFEVTFNPSAPGLSAATLSISNNDSDENPYDFAIAGTGLNFAPTDIVLSTLSIAENNAANATVGTLSATDPDSADTHTFTLVSGTGDTDNASFTIAGSSLRLTPSADYETKNSYSLRVQASDGNGGTFAKAFTVTVTDTNESPTDIALSTLSIVENNAANAAVGSLTATDPEGADTHTFTLVSGAGDTDNASFTLSGNSLRLIPSADFETKNSYSLRVQASDGNGGTFTKPFIVLVTNANEAPADITLSNATLAENNAANATVGTLSASDVDAGDSHTFMLVAGTGATDNASFSISGSSLRLTPSADFETKNSYSLRVRTADSGGLAFEKAFTLSITNVNELPSFTKGVNRTTSSTSAQTVNGWATGMNDGDSTVTQALAFNVSNNNPGLFTVAPVVSSGGTLTYAANGTIGTATVSVSLSDDASIGGFGTTLTSAVQTFTITVEPLVINGGGSNNFSGRTDLGSVVNAQITTTNLGASAEPNEPIHAGNGPGVSIWWRWTAPISGSVEISTHGSSIDTLLAVYTGTSLSTLTSVVSNDDADGLITSRVTFNATAGTTYNIAVDGFDGMAGAIVLALRMGSDAPPNDLFAARTTLAGANPAASGVNSRATVESGEPPHAGTAAAASVWWSWTPPANAVATVTAPGTGFGTRVAIYTGNALNALTQIAAGNGQAIFAATAGTVYQIAVDSADGATGLIQLNIASGPANPANDSFAGAAVLTEVASGNSIGATAESGEPAHAGSPAAKSVWWRWTAPNSDRISLSTAGSAFVNRFAVYTGNTVNALTEIAASASGSQFVSPVAGTTYYVAVDGVSGAAGAVVLSVGSAPPAAPSNDFFAARTSLGSPATASVSSSNIGAGSEPNEPDHAGTEAAASLWWTWTPPGPGSVIISTAGSGIDTRLAIYTGSALAGLSLVAANDDADASTTGSRVAFPVVPGTAYQIAVDGFAGYRGALALNITHVPPGTPPANDDFAAAAVLTAGTPAAGTTINATAQTGEPAHATLPASRSVWWQWTAPGNGTVRLNTLGSLVDTVLAVYSGNAVNALTRVTENDDRDSQTRQSAVEFYATSGTRYYIAVDARSGAISPQGSVSLSLTFTEERFLNDNFAERITLAALDLIEVQSDFTLATSEAGEPAHGGSPAARSGWWTWTAPRRGYYTLTAASAAPVRTAIYTGSALSSLINVTTGSGTTPASFLADPAVPLHFAVDGTGVIAMTLARVAPPANDNIASAAALSSTATGDLTQATAEEFEPSRASVPANQSVWFTFTGGTAPEVIALSTQGSTADTVLAVYSGPVNATVGALALLKASNDTAVGSTWSQVSFRGEPGTVYYAVVDAANGMGGGFTLALSRQTINPTSNDSFANAYLLTGPTVSITGSNAYGSREAGEPAHDGSAAAASTWWNWTAPVAGRYSVTTAGSSINTRIAIYTGTTLSGLTRLTSGRQRADFTAQQGVIYAIAIDGVDGAEGDIALQIVPLDAPSNNNLANAANFTGSATGLNVLATAEAGEVPHAGSSAARSLWWQWTPSQSGMATLTTVGSGFDTVLSVYRGTRFLGITTLLAENDDSAGTASTVTFIAKAGVTYLIALDGKNGASGFFRLDLSLETDAPPNDDFADAAELAGTVTTAIGDNLGATSEPGEDLHSGYLPDSSVWWKWTAGSNVNMIVDTAGSLSDTRLAVYTGNSVSQLTLIASNDDADILTVTSRLTFTATAGTTYYFVVDTLAATSGPITLTVAESGATIRGFQQWAAGKGFPLGQAGAASDPEGDGTPNLVEFALDSDPLAANSGAWFSLTLDSQKRMVATATVDQGAALVSVTIEFSSQPDAGFVGAGVPVFTRLGANRSNLVWSDTATVAPTTWRYARLRLEGYGQVNYSEVQGAVALDIPAATSNATRATTFLSSPLVMPRQTRAMITAVGVGSLTLQTALPASTGARCLILPDGTMTQITGNNGAVVQISDNLSGIAAPGMSVEIRPHRTLGSFFGAANEGGFTAGLNAASADTVLSVKPDGSVSPFFFTTLSGGRWVDGRYDPAASVVVPPEAGLIVQRLTGAAVTLYLTGAVRGPLISQMEQGYNLTGTGATRPVRLDSLGLFTGDPATALAAAANAVAADNILVMNPNGSNSSYFRSSSSGQTGWKDSAFNDSAGVLIAPGSAIYIHRKAPRAAFAWTLPTP